MSLSIAASIPTALFVISGLANYPRLVVIALASVVGAITVLRRRSI